MSWKYKVYLGIGVLFPTSIRYTTGEKGDNVWYEDCPRKMGKREKLPHAFKETALSSLYSLT